MNRGSVVVIGGGVAGLSTGIYAAANGYETTVLEMHSLPGGLCTAWEREGYTFDGCIHWFVGGKPGSDGRAWVWPGGGLPFGVLTGRWAVETVRASDQRPFVARV